MEKPRIRHIAINVADREKTAEYYKRFSGWRRNIVALAVRFIFPMVTWT